MCTGASGLMSSNAISSSSSCTRLDGISPATILQNKHDMRASIVRGARDGRSAAASSAGQEHGDEGGIDAIVDAVSRLGIRDVVIETAHGKTVIKGVARYQLDREQLFEAVKLLENWESDVVIDIAVEEREVRGYHTVERGETLASIAERYLGHSAREMKIFEANRDRMGDPDQILPGQQLLIPWR